ncbi:helix-turn-helix domain-containing protein [Actinomycetospora sp. TBRC 11914]|uniref:helix-turn-helix domain-containing protein n=1 Tax=Actinomycetospora sp. TBRC 11914 TaxID=2729387 RepID=UPI00145C3CF2|nr:helix-turn-helix transcriptional regulator [Actinomycetospora sp. TBRC 11914]NMO93516.1 helix-turn-helix transcriptional regulator [Actinomycetospora sp. TBRC 11914]
MTESLTIGERVAFYRRRRGLSQSVVAGLVGRTEDWLSKIENNRAELDRLSVIRKFADVLDVSLGDLLGEPTLLDWTAESGTSTVPALRAVLMDYRQLNSVLRRASVATEAPALDNIERDVAAVFDAYQASRFGFVTTRMPLLLTDALAAADFYDGPAGERAHAMLALAYQVSASTLTKLGECDLAWMAADRGLAAAQRSGSLPVMGSLLRSVVHSLLSTGRYDAAVQLTADGSDHLSGSLGGADTRLWSVYGSLFLAGAMASSRMDDRGMTRDFLEQAQRAAGYLGADANHMWTAFGPTNVAIHRVATAMELGDVQVAADLGPTVDTSGLPTERRVRHALETARALSVSGRRDQALVTVLDAERLAPEQVRHHFISRQLVLSWMKNPRGTVTTELGALAHRLRLAA